MKAVTPKQRVLAKWPGAYCFVRPWGSRQARIWIDEDTYIGTGPTPRQAWASAARSIGEGK